MWQKVVWVFMLISACTAYGKTYFNQCYTYCPTDWGMSCASLSTVVHAFMNMNSRTTSIFGNPSDLVVRVSHRPITNQNSRLHLSTKYVNRVCKLCFSVLLQTEYFPFELLAMKPYSFTHLALNCYILVHCYLQLLSSCSFHCVSKSTGLHMCT